MMDEDKIVAFLAGERFAVAGASADRAKYGNKVLRAYIQDGRAAHPINPHATRIEGLDAYPDVRALVDAVAEIHGVSVVTPPVVTQQLVEEIAAAGIRHVWMQPGAESEQAIARCEEHGLNVIAGGPCLLVALRYRE